MDACPFCGHSIDEVVARFGGTCAHCFGEVPGEEAATDQGPTPAPVTRTSPQRPMGAVLAISGGTVVGISIALLLLVMVRVTQRPSGPRPVMDFDDWPMPEVVAVAEAKPEPTRAPPPKRRKPRAEAYAANPEALAPPTDVAGALRAAAEAAPSGAGARRGWSGRGEAAPSTVPRPSRMSSAGTGALDISLGGGEVQRDDNVVLADPVAIRMMIGERLRRGIAELRGCYDRRLKQRPDLSGRWRLTFTVSQDGRATDAALAGLDEPDEALEGCLREHVVRRWAFAPVAEPTEVSKTLSFHVAR
ncbi:MAG: AgmX/PglI C-terminal domain-containing protein [Myxococcota bacterium]